MLTIKLAWRKISKSQNISIIGSSVFIPRTLRFYGKTKKKRSNGMISCACRVLRDWIPLNTFHQVFSTPETLQAIKALWFMSGVPNTKWNNSKDDKKDQQQINITPVQSPVLSQWCSVYPSIRRSFSELISCSNHQSFMILSLKSWIEKERGKHALKHTRAFNDGDICGGLWLLPKDASQLRKPHRQVVNLPIVQPHFDEGLALRVTK